MHGSLPAFIQMETLFESSEAPEKYRGWNITQENGNVSGKCIYLNVIMNYNKHLLISLGKRVQAFIEKYQQIIKKKVFVLQNGFKYKFEIK